MIDLALGHQLRFGSGWRGLKLEIPDPLDSIWVKVEVESLQIPP